MRYLIATIALLVIVINPSFLVTGDACAKGNTNFSQRAWSQSTAIDRTWQDMVGKTPSGLTGTRGTALTSRSTWTFHGSSTSGSSSSGHGQMHRYGKRWDSRLNTSGYIHKGISGAFMPLTSRGRNGASRGTGILRNPASAGRGGNRRLPTNFVKFNRNGSVRSGSERSHPKIGTRFSSSSRRSRVSSIGNLGSSRTRKRR